MTTQRLPYALVVDDHPLARAGLERFLEGLDELRAVHSASDADGVDKVIAEYGIPGLALVDFWLSDGAVNTLLAHLRRRAPDARIIVVSGDDNPALYDMVMKAGVDGFLSKKEQPSIVRTAVLAVLGGGKWFARTVPPTADGWSRDVPVTPLELGLTTRQAHTLQLMLEGHSNKRIAQALLLSEATVKEYVTAVLRKLNVGTRFEAIAKLKGRRLVVPEQHYPGSGADSSGIDNQR